MIAIGKNQLLATFTNKQIFNVSNCELFPFFRDGFFGNMPFISKSGSFYAYVAGEDFVLVSGRVSFGRAVPEEAKRIAKKYHDAFLNMSDEERKKIRDRILNVIYKNLYV